MPKQTKTAPKLARFRALSMAVALIAVFGIASIAHADKYDDQINALRAQNNAAQGQLNSLTSQASSYQDAINQLQSQITAVQAQIGANQAQQADLQAKIVANQAIVDAKKISLAATVKAMYLDGQMSTIEELATSKNLSDYIDKAEYRSVVQNQLNTTIKEIAVIQAELQKQKIEVEVLLASEKSQNDQLAAAQAEKANLLAYNQGQQDQFNSQITTNNDSISKLKQQQALELALRYGSSGGIAGGGGYPWGNAVCIHTGSASGPCRNYDWSMNGSIWNYAVAGYGYRNCTDWVAWKTGAPGGLGNANTWAARSNNVSTNPHRGDAAVDEWGPYGHVMYVESVNGDTIIVSDYNRIGDGLYRITQLTKVGEGRYQSPTGQVATLKFVTF